MKKKKEIIVLTLMCFMLSIAIAVQIKTVKNNGATVGGNQKEGNLKAQVLKMKEKYENQYNDLQNAEKELAKVRQEATGNNEELKELENKIKEDNLLLGNTAVSGQGINITLSDGKNNLNLELDEVKSLIIHDLDVLQVINELKNAGAEAISINGERITNTSAITCDGNVIIINGKKTNMPIQIFAIGLPESLSTLNRPGGTLEAFTKYGKMVELKKNSNIKIPKFTGVYTFKYAKTVK